MCGISGYFGKCQDQPADLLGRFNDAQSYRGPDAAGIWISSDGRAGLGHRRLSIVDLSSNGNQPMRSESGRYIITMNAEIYNFRDLRQELAGMGCRFRSTSDTEVMLAAFERWGVADALQRFNGMFAAAVWDKLERKGYLFRDRLGVKPLYYQWHDETLFFSSELTAPFARLSNRPISRDALALLLRQGYVPAPYSIYEGIFKLLPGVVATVSLDHAANGRFTSEFKYWDTQERVNQMLECREQEMTEEGALERLDNALRRSIRDRMISDVPLGAFLSGGIDSSLIVSYMREVHTAQVRTFTIGFEDSAYSEAPFARKVAEHLEAEHTELLLTERDALEVVPSLAEMYKEPFADSSQIPTYLVSKLAREDVTVALSGDGGDELFCGYDRYRRILNYRRAARMIPAALFVAGSKVLSWPQVPQLLHAFSGDRQITRVLGASRIFSAEMRRNLRSNQWGPVTLPERLVKGATPGVSIPSFSTCTGNATEQAMSDDLLDYLPDDILTKVDRSSMAVSLEVRAPFADDYELFATAWKIPSALKTNESGGKLILRKLLARFVPPELTERPKMGFAVPLTKWLGGALRDWVDECVSPVRLEQEGYLRSSEVAKVRARALGGDEYFVHKLWSICQFQSWLSLAQTSPKSAMEGQLRAPQALSNSGLQDECRNYQIQSPLSIRD
jgi:asparagine synthase (glutamine-hydrolysing)